MAEETEAAAPRKSGGGGNPITRKIGPLPMWAWLAIFTVVIFVYAYIKKKSSAATASTTAASTTAANTPGGVDASLVPQFVNQTYTQVTPPESPTINVTVPTAAATTPATAATTATTPTAAGSSSTQPPIMNGKYVVKAGQTLAQVAAQYGISRVTLAHANGLGTGAGLRTGQVLNVPSPAPGGTPNKAQ